MEFREIYAQLDMMQHAVTKMMTRTKTPKMPKSSFETLQPVSEELKLFLGVANSSRLTATKKLMDYVVEKKLLQDDVIHADEKLAPLFGGDATITLYEVQMVLDKHLLKKTT